MGTSFAPLPVESASYSLHRRLFPRFSLPGSLTIDEELEDAQTYQQSGSSSSIRQVLTSRKTPTSHNKTEVDVSMTTDQRRNSYMSASSARSYSDAGTPSAGALAADRESMRTPRPLTSESPKATRLALLPDSAFANRRKEASDATIEAKNATQHLEGSSQNNSPTRNSSEVGVRNTAEYSANSLGKASIASSAYTGRQSGSEYGDRTAFSTSSAARNAKKKGVAPPEVLVIVRPPPSKQVNPLNLQIQLVIPQSQSTAATSRTSLDSSRDDNSVISASLSTGSNGMAPSTSSNLTALTPAKPSLLRRSSSTHSARSSRSEASSGGMSYSSSTTGASRRVTPLYNLNFHSITATTVTDAGTDDKVAKFGKKGVEIDGFGQLEPHELIRGVNDLVSLQERRRSSIKGSLALQGQKSGSNLNLTDAMSEVSRTRSRQGGSPSIPTRVSTDMGPPVHLRPNEEPPTSFDAMSPEAKNPTEGGIWGGKFLSKFKRFSINPASNTTSSRASNYSFGSPSRTGTAATDASNVASVFSKVTSAAVNKLKETGGGVQSSAGLSDEQSEIISAKESMISMGAQANGINIDTPQLIVGGGLRADSRRTEGYYWTVRRWNRRNAQEDVEEGGSESWHKEAGNNPILTSVWKRFNIVNRMGGQEMHPPCRDVPVRFEWTRNTDRRKSSAVSSGHGKISMQVNGSAASKVKLANMPRSSFSRPSTDNKNGDALKPPKSNSRPSSLYSNMSAHRRSVDAGSQAGSQVGSAEDVEMSDPEDSETVWACHLVLGPTTRIPIGSLTPTPHHPKLVGQLTIPFPLPDLSQSGLGTDGAGLTREELKDIISVTCLFVVIRERFGGLVKKKR